MAYLPKNGGIVFASNQLPTPQPLPGAPGLMQYLQSGQLNQNMATIVPQNNSGVQQMLKGKLKALGITEITTGIICIIIGSIQVSSSTDDYHYLVGASLLGGTPWWSGIVFIIAGSLAVAVEKSPTDCMIKGCLSMNIISAIFCTPAIIMYAVDLALKFSYYDGSYQRGTAVSAAILLVLAMLTMAISIAISCFNCRAVTCCCTPPVPIIVVYNNPSAQPNPSHEFNGNPPPYNMRAMANVYAE